MPVVVSGLRELNRAFANTDKETRLAWRAEERRIAEPIRQGRRTESADVDPPDAGLAEMGQVPGRRHPADGVRRTPPARRENSRHARGMRRPNLADLLETRALVPAGEQHEHQVDMEMERLMDRVAAGFNLG